MDKFRQRRHFDFKCTVEDEGNKVSHKDVHEKLWAARDFEINHLWQRSIFLATFITLTFTLYFSLVDRIISPSYDVSLNHSAIVNSYLTDAGDKLLINVYDGDDLFDDECIKILILNGVSTVGFAFSILWICMARGSKYMYERLEHGIDKVYTNGSGFLDEELNQAIEDEFFENLWEPGAYSYLPRHGALPLSDYNYHLYSLDGGKFSSSKINIFIGHILVTVWIAILFINQIIIDGSVSGDLQDCGIKIAVLIAFFIIAFSLYETKVWKLAVWIKIIAFMAILLVYTFAIHSWFVVAFALLYVLLALLISYAVLSDNRLRFFDYLILVISALATKYNPEAMQVSWVQSFLNQKNDDVCKHVEKVLKDYQNRCDNPIYNRILKGVLKEKNVRKYCVRHLLSNDELRDLFENALMFRNRFNEGFKGVWNDSYGNKIIIGENEIELNVNLPICGFDMSFDVSNDFDKTRLFADTDWCEIRKSKKPDIYKIPAKDRKLYLIHKDSDGSSLYMTFDLNPSFTDRIYHNIDADAEAKDLKRLRVDVIIINPAGSSESVSDTRKHYSFELYR